MDEEHFAEIDAAMLFIEEARARTERAVAALRAADAEPPPDRGARANPFRAFRLREAAQTGNVLRGAREPAAPFARLGRAAESDAELAQGGVQRLEVLPPRGSKG